MAGQLPDWWDWDLEFTGHLLRRMLDRGFSETELRSILSGVQAIRESSQDGRWIAIGKLDGQLWEVVVEPDEQEECVVVVTAYRVE